MVERHLHGIGSFNRPFGDTGKLYMIKKRGYYGFFVVFSEIKRVYICNGGVLKQLPGVGSIEKVLAEFDVMIDAYLRVFSGFRRYQEQIAAYIRGFGGDGKIHGLIVDIDYFSHVGINPVSGEVAFYYSPMFGCVQNYADMGALLERHAPWLYSAYKQLSVASPVSYCPQDVVVESEFVDVKRGGKSFYGASRYMSSVQRLFSCNILRVWDENVLNKTKSAVSEQKALGSLVLPEADVKIGLQCNCNVVAHQRAPISPEAASKAVIFAKKCPLACPREASQGTFHPYCLSCARITLQRNI